MAKDLNIVFRYDRIKPIKYRPQDINKLASNCIRSEADWSNKEFTTLKKYFRNTHYLIQGRRCAYCRRKLNPSGINEHIDHIVAKSAVCGWMFKPRNLVLTCYQCNTQKSVVSATRPNIIFKRLPRRARYYTLYNPYVHRWSDHFEIEDNLFIKAKSKLGEDTIKKLNLLDYKYSIVYADEANIFDDTAIKRATKRLYAFDKSTIEYKGAKKLIKEIEKHL